MAWVHLVFGIVLLLAVVIGLFGAPGTAKVSVMVARFCYLFLIVSGGFIAKYAWSENPWLTAIKIFLALMAIGWIEIAFSKKKRNELTAGFLWVTIGLVVVVGVIGLWLSGGYPVR
ncbi:hypothetical protein LFYK43_07420 [Ligilactobacillus salitolerans]|uniref:Uncharacterized protein n=1 Tax=Ligilactobacillus salitolerans TaxID=1808352 RepID=A0A401IRW9_9LACO|nr:DUF1516 family protein [Ligilactobacillus salitolerans]GBG94283.1 hypothetical protein LFYK43_07420 [Ligilactobacillus salitolerans]